MVKSGKDLYKARLTASISMTLTMAAEVQKAREATMGKMHPTYGAYFDVSSFDSSPFVSAFSLMTSTSLSASPSVISVFMKTKLLT